MPATVTVNPYFNKEIERWTNYLSWTFPSLPPSGSEVIIGRSIGVTPDIDATDFGFTELTRLKNTATSYVDEKINNNLKYFYSVRSSNEDPEELPIVASSITFTPVLPKISSAPKNFRVKKVTNRIIEFNWGFETKNQSPVTIEYTKNISNELFQTLVSNISPSVTSYSLYDLDLDSLVYFRAFVKTDEGDFLYSNTVSFQTLMFSQSIPVQPTDLTFTPLTRETAKLTWTNLNENAENLEHLIWLVTPSGPSILYDSVLAVDNISASSVILEGLNAGSNYCVRCQARTRGGESPISDAVTGIVGLETNIPTAITNLTGTNLCNPLVVRIPEASLVLGSNVQRLTWTNPATELATLKSLRYSTNSGFSTFQNIYLNLTTTSIDVPFLTANTTYYYKIVSENSAGAVSSTTFTLNLPEPPVLPTNLSLQANGNTTLAATWDDNSADEQFFIVQISGQGSTYDSGSVILPENTESYIFDNLEPGENYNVRVFSLGYGGVSSTAANWASATITIGNTTTAPSTPQDLYLSGQKDPSTIVFSFTDTATDEDGFEIAYGLVPTNNQPLQARFLYREFNEGTGSVSGEITDLIPNTNYFMALRALKGNRNTLTVTRYSNYANVSGSTDILLPINTQPFVFNNQLTAVNITSLTSSIFFNYPTYERETVITGSFNDPFPNYGDGFDLFRVNQDGSEILQKSYNSTDARNFSLNLGLLPAQQLSFVARKFLNRFTGDKFYSSGTISSISVPSVLQYARFDVEDLPEYQLPLRVESVDYENKTLTLSWLRYLNSSSMSLFDSRTPDVPIYSENPASNSAGSYTVTGINRQETYTFSIIIYGYVIDGSQSTYQTSITVIPDRLAGDPDIIITPPGNTDPNVVYSNTETIESFYYTNPSRNIINLSWTFKSLPVGVTPTVSSFYAIGLGPNDPNGVTGLVARSQNNDANAVTVNLPQGGNYVAVVYGVNANSILSIPYGIGVFLGEPQLTPPTNFRFTSTNRQSVIVAWSPDPFATSYTLRKVVRNSTGTIISTSDIIIQTPSTSYIDSSLIANTTVEYSLRVNSPVASSQFTTVLNYTVPDQPRPQDPPTVVDAPRACVIQGVKEGNVYYQIRRN